MHPIIALGSENRVQKTFELNANYVSEFDKYFCFFSATLDTSYNSSFDLTFFYNPDTDNFEASIDVPSETDLLEGRLFSNNRPPGEISSCSLSEKFDFSLENVSIENTKIKLLETIDLFEDTQDLTIYFDLNFELNDGDLLKEQKILSEVLWDDEKLNQNFFRKFLPLLMSKLGNFHWSDLRVIVVDSDDGFPFSDGQVVELSKDKLKTSSLFEKIKAGQHKRLENNYLEKFEKWLASINLSSNDLGLVISDIAPEKMCDLYGKKSELYLLSLAASPSITCEKNDNSVMAFSLIEWIKLDDAEQNLIISELLTKIYSDWSLKGKDTVFLRQLQSNIFNADEQQFSKDISSLREIETLAKRVEQAESDFSESQKVIVSLNKDLKQSEKINELLSQSIESFAISVSQVVNTNNVTDQIILNDNVENIGIIKELTNELRRMYQDVSDTRVKASNLTLEISTLNEQLTSSNEKLARAFILQSKLKKLLTEQQLLIDSSSRPSLTELEILASESSKILEETDAILNEPIEQRTFGPTLNSREMEIFRSSILKCLIFDGRGPASELSVTLGMNMMKSGKVYGGSIRLVSGRGGTENEVDVAFQAARRAILRCQKDGYDLPIESYSSWKNIEITFSSGLQ